MSLSNQTWALIQRYHITILRSPISSAIRVIFWPGLLIGLCIYAVISSKENEGNEYFKFEASIPTISLLLTVAHVYHFTDWLVTDKSSGIKSLMISMGLRRNSYYIGNFICSLELFLPLMLMMAVVSIVYLFEGTKASPIAILTIFLLFVIHLIGFIFAFASAIASSVYVSWMIALLLLEPLIHGAVIWMMTKSEANLWPLILFLGSISPYESLRILTNSYALCENCNETKLSIENGLVSQPVYLIIIAMTFWSLLAFAFTRWFDEVCPWQNVTAVKSPLFCIKRSKKIHESEVGESRPRGSKYFEESTSDREVGIRLSNLTKCFKKIPVVNNISFNIYRGETTLLLGHNGAGKTTLMSLILGKLSSDKGKVQVGDNQTLFDERDGLGIGVCPQTSILDDNLNVKQHLQLFHDIKSSGMSRPDRDRHIEQTIADVSLNAHKSKRPFELSGGMKRKLSLAMAFVGHSSILILDEPSSGLDPDSRVFVWDAIRRYRADRTVLLSTQHMEEADYLGDRIAIMKDGKIICCGSSIFLNNIFGTGYKLRVECPDSKQQQIVHLVRKYFDSAKFIDETLSQNEHDNVKDFVIELLSSKKTDMESNMIHMLEELEKHSKDFGILSYGLRSSSIEDVLLNTNKSLTEDIPDTTQLTLTSKSGHIATMTEPIRPPSSTFITNQLIFLRAFLYKHFQTYKRDWKSIILLRLVSIFVTSWLVINSLNTDLPGPILASTSRYTPLDFTVGIMIIHFIYYPTLERVSKFKIIQLSSHTNYIVYWIANIIADSISILVMLVSFNIFLSTTFRGSSTSPLSFRLLMSSSIIVFGLASALLAYVLSLILNNPRRSIGYFALIMIAPSMVYALTTVLSLAMKKDLNGLQDALNYIYVALLPSEALQYTFFGFQYKCYLSVSEDCTGQAGFSPVLYGLISLIVQVITYGAILHLVESNNLDLERYTRLGNICPFGRKAVLPGESYDIDKDVVDETTKAVQSIDSAQLRQPYSMVAADLNKSYYRNQRKAVDHLSFTVNRGECFGLLGVNGAGKTTTFSMLVAESKPDSGHVWLNGCFNTESVDKYRRQLGFDPQSSPEMSLSPVEALCLMARLRLLSEPSIAMVVNSILELLDMSEHANKSASQLSGGTKRKLSLAMSLIGNPSLLAMDEPTAGVDPIARRSIWQLLKSLRGRGGSSIIISSHAMEECEAICDRISIMARGRLRCIGTFLHLKSKFAQGCTIRVQFSAGLGESMNKQTISELGDRLREHLGPKNVKLVDLHANGGSFRILDKNIRRSVMFKLMKDFKQEHPNLSYIINDSSLEDIFISLAREQQQLEQPTSTSVHNI